MNTNMRAIDAAIVTLPAGAVTTPLLQDLAVTEAKLDVGCVSTAKIQPAAVTADEIAAEAINPTHLVPHVITEDKISDDAVTADHVKDGEVLPVGLDVPDERPITFGTSVLRRAGNLIIATLPDTDPATVGALWNDSGTLKISAGA